jgi:transposase
MAKFREYSIEQGELLPSYLSDWIPDNHLVRLISDIVDQLDLSEITKHYSNRGEEAYHPAMLLKLWFYGYATGLFSSRKIQTNIHENIPFRWLCAGHQPDFRTISDFRKNNLDLMPFLFKKIIGIAMNLGYVSLGHVSIDGSKIKANASKHKAMSRERMKKEIKRLEQEINQALQEAEQADQLEEQQLSLLPTDEARITDRQQRLEKIKMALKELEERKSENESKEPEKDQINFTDSESRIMTTRNQGTIQGYNPQIAVDEANHFIVGLNMTNDPTDVQQFIPVIESVCENTGSLPIKASCDAGYFSASNINHAIQNKIDAYFAPTREGKKEKNPYDKTNFTYNGESNTYTCPAGQTLIHVKTEYANNPDKPTRWKYESTACVECPFQSECVKSKTGKRAVHRTDEDPMREEMRTKVQSTNGSAIYSKRKGIVEPAWGEIKEIQNFRQFHLRTEKKVTGEFFLLAASFNLRKLHSMQFPKKDTLYKREKSAQKRKKAI